MNNIPDLKNILGVFNKWINNNTDTPSMFNYAQFSHLEPVKALSQEQQKILWDKISKIFFRILMSDGDFSLNGIGKIKMIYRFYLDKGALSLSVIPILTDSGSRKHFNTYQSIERIRDMEKLEKKIL